MGLKVAADVPQILLDLFNPVDFAKIEPEQKEIALQQIEKLTKSMTPMKNANTPKIANPEPKRIAKDFEQRLLDIFNKIDWSQVQNLNIGINFLKSFVNKLPMKK